MPIERETVEFVGLHFSRLDFEEAVEDVAARARSDRFSYIVTPNVDHVVKLHSQSGAHIAAFRCAYEDAAHRYCDSRILSRLAGYYGVALSLVPGSDLTARLFGRRFDAGQKVAIIGGGGDLADSLAREFPGIGFVQHRPPMGMLADADAMMAAEDFVSGCRADYVLFATGAPQSEILARRCLARGEARGVGLCIGASIEFLTGEQRRAPRWMQRAGLEWLHRLLSNPARLWRRYLVEGPRIFRIAARWNRRRRSG